MRWVLLTGVVATTAFAGGSLRFSGGFHFGPSATQLGPAWTGFNTSGRPVPLVPITNYTAGYPVGVPVIYPTYWYPQAVYAPPPQPPPAPAPVVIEREVIIERPAPAPAPPPQVIVIEQPAPAPVAPPAPPPAPPPPPEPPKPSGPRTPGPDVYSWVDADGVVNYSTRAPTDPKVKAKKLATLSR